MLLSALNAVFFPQKTGIKVNNVKNLLTSILLCFFSYYIWVLQISVLHKTDLENKNHYKTIVLFLSFTKHLGPTEQGLDDLNHNQIVERRTYDD